MVTNLNAKEKLLTLKKNYMPQSLGYVNIIIKQDQTFSELVVTSQ